MVVAEAEAAVKRFNHQEVDDRTLKVESRGSGTTFSLAPTALVAPASKHHRTLLTIQVCSNPSAISGRQTDDWSLAQSSSGRRSNAS